MEILLNRLKTGQERADTLFQLRKKFRESRSVTRSSGGNRRTDSWRKGMDTFLSVPAHFTDSPLIFPRSRIDRHRWPKLRREGKVGWRTGHWVIIVSRSRELFRSKEDTVARVRIYEAIIQTGTPNRAARDERISVPEAGGGSRSERDRSEQKRRLRAFTLVSLATSDTRELIQDARTTRRWSPPEIESLLSLSSSLLF